MNARLPTYGPRWRFGPWRYQAVRFIGRSLEQLGQRLDSWSWSWPFTDDDAARAPSLPIDYVIETWTVSDALDESGPQDIAR